GYTTRVSKPGFFSWITVAEISGEIDRIEPSAIDRSQDAVMRSWSWVALTIALTALAALTWQEIREA
uniref:hypothetical protein n=1 Tax=Candidatus Entotheonella palauensis TaxID=93172 RepID=UPI0015C4B8E2